MTGLPVSSRGFNYDAIIVVVDRLTKIRYFIPIVNGSDNYRLDA